MAVPKFLSWIALTGFVAALAATQATAPDVFGPAARATRPQQVSESSLNGLRWSFVRIRYQAWPELRRHYQTTYWSEPWAIDAPVAEQNLSRRVSAVTALDVGDPIVLTLDERRLWDYPWIYFVEPGTMNLTDDEVAILREFLLRGGTATFDDFHGPIEWTNFERQMKRVFPDREIVELDPDIRCSARSTASTRILRSRAWDRFCRGARGRNRASCRIGGRSSMIKVARWCWSTGTRTWVTAGSGRTPSPTRDTCDSPATHIA
jgi:hypothetical protein